MGASKDLAPVFQDCPICEFKTDRNVFEFSGDIFKKVFFQHDKAASAAKRSILTA
jgi:hypothetical protein